MNPRRIDPVPPATTADTPADDPARVQARAAFSAGDPVPLGLVAFGIPLFIAGSALSGWWGHP
ncbi:MAG: hypothetical protein ACREQM_19400, partial [Candidatus Dormibacteraceae bacterium]